MSKLVRSQASVGTSFHISDCYVWAEIFYLDSATDYREYLPKKGVMRAGFGEFTNLDDSSGFLTHAAGFFLRPGKPAFPRSPAAIASAADAQRKLLRPPWRAILQTYMERLREQWFRPSTRLKNVRG